MANLVTLISFNGADGDDNTTGYPLNGPLLLDASGNLFGTTYGGGANGDGEVFELPGIAGVYATTPVILASFNGSGNGGEINSGLIEDGNGDLFGTTGDGGSTGYGTVFEIMNTASGYASTPTTLVTFTGTGGLGLGPEVEAAADAQGDLFGVVSSGGNSFNGSVFEVVKMAGGYATTPTLIAPSSLGANPFAALVVDASGDLFGSTGSPLTGVAGTVFEIARTAGGYASPNTIASFNNTDGAYPSALVADANGDLFGFTTQGGASGDGTLFEIVKTAGVYASTPTTLVTFNGTNGAYSQTALIVDAVGDLFGTISYDGPGGYGSVFEIKNTPNGYACAPTTIVSFPRTDSPNQYTQYAPTGLVADAEGDLLVETQYGGTNGTSDGLVFEVTDAGYVVACFCQGTGILTARGEIPVQALAVGDHVTTHGGMSRPIAWIGHRRIDCSRHPRPIDVWPVRIQADAFGLGQPHRDLLVSPDHAVFVDGVLIPVRYLINDATIVQERRDDVAYWHVELQRHDVVLADGLPCESYLDTGNRGAFANGGPAVHLHPDFALQVWAAEACAPLVRAGANLEAARSFLIERAAALGHSMTGDPALCVIVDGRRLPPVLADGWHRFSLPPQGTMLRLVSRCAVPARVRDNSADHRMLGVAVCRIRLDGQEIALIDASLGSGWHGREEDDGGNAWRWTDGNACLAIEGARRMEVQVIMTERYWLEPPELSPQVGTGTDIGPHRGRSRVMR